MQSNGGGSIVAIGSAYAHAAPPAGMAPYVVAKSALAAYIRCLAVDYGPTGVRANIVAPGMTNTALLASVTERARKVAAIQNPMRRLAFPEDVVGAVAFLASPEAAYVNGHTLVVSGGGLMLWVIGTRSGGFAPATIWRRRGRLCESSWRKIPARRHRSPPARRWR